MQFSMNYYLFHSSVPFRAFIKSRLCPFVFSKEIVIKGKLGSVPERKIASFKALSMILSESKHFYKKSNFAHLFLNPTKKMLIFDT